MKGLVVFDEWAPDRPTLAQGVRSNLSIARGVAPRVDGSGPVAQLVDLNLGALAGGRAQGHGVIRDSAGDLYNFVGTQTTLELVTASTPTDVTRSGGAYNGTATTRWEFAVLGKDIIAVQRADVPQYFDVEAPSTAFDDLSAPKAAHVATIRDQVFLGDILDGSTEKPRSLRWGALGNGQSYPTPGDPSAIAVLAGEQELKGEGRLQRIIGGTEVGLIFLERNIYRADFVQAEPFWTFSVVDTDRGLLTPGACVAKGRIVLYLDEDGWFVHDYAGSRHVGKGKIDRYFFNDVSPSQLHRISAVADPEKTMFVIGYMSSSAVSSPDRWMIYDWAVDQWSHGDQAHELLCRSLTIELSVDDLPSTLFVDDAVFGDLPVDQFAAAGPSKLSAWSTSNKLGTFSGGGMEATLETGDLALFGGREGLLTSIRPLARGGQPIAPYVQVSAIDDLEDSHSFGPVSTLNRMGRCPVRKAGRYHKVRLVVPAGSVEAEIVGFEWEGQPGGEG